jgi:uncharacterized repeat protein (TIGR03803 family)
MQRLGFARYALSISVAAASLTACGGLQPSLGTPARGVQTSRADGIRRLLTSSYRVLYSFDRFPNGANPLAGLINVKGTLYGTTSLGGKGCGEFHERPYGCGTVFSITTNGAEHLVYSFHPWKQGAHPESGLIHVDGTFYGTTYKGGGNHVGAVYSINASGSETVLHSFEGGSDGSYPRAPLLAVNSTFYGTTAYGGATTGHGTVYSISASGGYTVLHRFKGRSDGAYPDGGLIDVNGTLYGTTLFGGGSSACVGEYGCGTVYSVTPSGVEKVLHRFASGSDGAEPSGELIAINGTLYGTTGVGGGGACARGCGTVYSVTPSGVEKVLHRFTSGAGGVGPSGGLIDVNGTLYGTTTIGGKSKACYGNGCGTVYSISTSGAESVLYRFAGGSDGSYPVAPLVSVDGTFYGITHGGGLAQQCGDGCGTVFAFKP